MEVNSSIRCVVVGVVVGLMACGQIEQPPVLDKDGEVIDTPPPGEPWLLVTKITPELTAKTISTRPTFAIQFNQYINEESYLSYGVASLNTGGKRAFGRADYVMTRKTIFWTPYSSLIDGFEYKFNLGLTDVRSVTDSPLWPEKPGGTFVTDGSMMNPVDEDDLKPTPHTWQQVDAIFEAKCNRCHDDTTWGITTLKWQTLVKNTSAQVQRALVRPFSPSNSYLMHKILPDFPTRQYTVQPPPWDEDSVNLTEAEIWTIEQWIKAGAKGPNQSTR